MSSRPTGRRYLRIRALADRLTHSLFFLPAVFVVTSIVAANAVIQVDRQISDVELPRILDTSVDNARTLLGTLAGGTITAASIVFSLTLVTVQLASSQYSPRTLHNFLGDRFQQVVIGIVLGTFSFCLMTLRGIDGSGSDEPFVPRITVATALVLGTVALFAVIASINHTASGLRVASIANRITDDLISVVTSRFEEEAARPILQATTAEDVAGESVDPTTTLAFGSPDRGWIQQMSIQLVASAVPDGSTVHVEATVGSYVQEGQPILLVSPIPDDVEHVHRALTRSVVVGPHRTLQQDVGFGIVQLSDIALRALSPGINDPHTAQEILPRIGAVLTELAVRDLTPAECDVDGRRIVRSGDLDHDGFCRLALDPVCRAAADQPQVLSDLVLMLATARDEATRRRTDAHVGALGRQAGRLLDRLPDGPDGDEVRSTARRVGFLADREV